MDAPFEALDMFPDSMHRLLSYEDMLSGVLTGNSFEDHQGAKLDRNGVDTMDTCGFPLFSHDLQTAEPNSTMDTPSMDKDGMGTMKRSRSFAVDDERPRGFEALVLEELEDVVFQLTSKTRICFRDAFFRLAEGNASRVPAVEACPERGPNAIDRTVADLAMRKPCPAPLDVHGSCLAGGSGAAAAQSATGWTDRAYETGRLIHLCLPATMMMSNWPCVCEDAVEAEICTYCCDISLALAAPPPPTPYLHQKITYEHTNIIHD